MQQGNEVQSGRRILLLMSGSIACAKATGLITAWIRAGHQVRVACTPATREFVGKATLEGLSGQPVFDDTFAPGQVMDHIGLAQWADLVVLCPATANTLCKLAAGIADDAVGALWQACWGRGAPLFAVPAMNTHMWNYPATRKAVASLKDWGVHVLPVAKGDLACGEHGDGRMLEVTEILAQLEQLLLIKRSPPDAPSINAATAPAPKRILVTGGGTREPIDAVRYIGNLSTGRTAARLADALHAAGHAVTWLGAGSAQEPQSAGTEKLRFNSYSELATWLRKLLSERDFDCVIHAAAVSDFSVAAPASGKLPSDAALELRLQPNPKLLDSLREWSRNPGLRVVGFKLTAGADAQARATAIAKLLQRAGADAVVHNDLQEISPEQHGFTLHFPGGESKPAGDADALAAQLSNWLATATVETTPAAARRQQP